MAANVASYRSSDWSGRGKGPLFPRRGTKRQIGNAALADFKRQLREFPLSLAHDIAQRAAPAITDQATSAFDSGNTVYGEDRPKNVYGHPLTLIGKTGNTRRSVKFVSNGTIVRCVLGTKYAKYLIGKYGILPNGALPASWSKRLDGLLATTTVAP
jgi:hypothetical protein